MIKTILDNPVFFGCYLVFLLSGLGVLMVIEQGDAIFFFNEHRSLAADLLFKYFTKMGEEIAYLVLGLLFLFIRIRISLLLPVTGFLVTVLSYITKSFFAHKRPAKFFREGGLIDLISPVEGITMFSGDTSFPSGHTFSAFALYGLLALILPRKKALAFVLFFIALSVGISRIYLVQHFLKDVLMGATMGVILALIIYGLQSLKPRNPNNWYDRSLAGLIGLKVRKK